MKKTGKQIDRLCNLKNTEKEIMKKNKQPRRNMRQKKV